MEDLLRGADPKDNAPQAAEPRQTHCPDFTPDEDHEEDHTSPPSPTSWERSRPTAVCQPAAHQGG